MASVATPARRRFVFDVHPVWRLMTSARFTVFYIALLATIGMIGVLVPQIPEAMRGNDAAVAAWLDTKRDTFGVLTDPMHRIGLFNVFGQRWFALALAFLVVNVSVCTFNRWAPTFRNVYRPPEQVPASFYERAHNRALLAPVDAADAEHVLRSLRFKVKTREEDGATYLFADRYPWTQLATFISHLALILFIAGGLVTVLTGFTANLSIGEGATMPVFAVTDPDQIQVRVDETIGRFGERGNALDFRSHLTLFRNGEEVKSGYTTVNNPLEYGGYRFHQAGFFPFGAKLRIREVATGNTVFDETFPLEQANAAPRVTIADSAGNELLHDVIVPTDLLPAATGAIVNVPGTTQVFWIGVAPVDDGESWELIAYDPQAADGGEDVRLQPDETAAIGKLQVTFDEIEAIPSAVGLGVPGGGEQVLAQMHDGPNGQKALTLIDGERQAITLATGETLTVDGYEYTFEGQREFAGISVKRDSGAWFIWVATGLLLAGLAITFYVPRRRLWLKLTGSETRIAALAEKSGGFERDMRTLARRLDVPVPPELEEER